MYRFSRTTAPMQNWLIFYVECRRWPQLIGAIKLGKLPTVVIRLVENLISRLPELDIPDIIPVLLHKMPSKTFSSA